MSAVTESEEREPRGEPVAEAEPEEELVAEAEPEDEPVAEEPEDDDAVIDALDDSDAEPDQSDSEEEEVKVTSVETVSAIDLVMEDSRQDLAGAEPGRPGPLLNWSVRWDRPEHPSSRCAWPSWAPARRGSTPPGSC